MEFNVKPNLDIVNAIKQAQEDGIINKPTILKTPNGSITAYNPMCLFKSELQEQIIDTSDGLELEVFPVTLIKTNDFSPTDYVTVSLTHPAGDNMGLLSLMANAIEKLTNGKFGNYVTFTDIYVFTTYDTKRLDGSLTGQLSVVQNDVAVLPILKNEVN